MTSSSIKDHAQVVKLLSHKPEYLETFTTYAPAHRFIVAEVSDESLSFSVQDEDGSIFAMALGKDPIFLECDRVATSRGLEVDLNKFTHRADWDFYSIDTDNFADSEKSEVASNDQEIEALLKAHAPDSSVWPGNEEILFWGSIREDENLVATGAIVKWRTGQVMFASIATHTDFRGRGLAQKLVSRMLSSVEALGVKHVGLGVFAQNYSAKRAYEQVGFELIGEFSSYSRI